MQTTSVPAPAGKAGISQVGKCQLWLLPSSLMPEVEEVLSSDFLLFFSKSFLRWYVTILPLSFYYPFRNFAIAGLSKDFIL